MREKLILTASLLSGATLGAFGSHYLGFGSTVALCVMVLLWAAVS